MDQKPPVITTAKTVLVTYPKREIWKVILSNLMLCAKPSWLAMMSS